MEIAVPSPLTPGFHDYRASSRKALPPLPGKPSAPCYSSHSAPTSRKGSYIDPEEERPSTPMISRKPSSTYFNLREERPKTPRSALQNEALASKTLLVPPDTQSSTSMIPDKVTQRPPLRRSHGASDFGDRRQPSENSILADWKVSKYEYSDEEYGSSLPVSKKASSQGSWVPSEPMPSAEERAKDYASVLPVFVPEPRDSESGFLSTGVSARITDVVDEPLMPASLLLSGNSEDRKLSSQFSSSDSDVESLIGESKNSLKARAKKAFNSRKTPPERKAHVDCNLSRHSQGSELTTANLTSLQNGIDEMYNTLTGFYSPSKPRMKDDPTDSKNNVRRPATPLTADGRSGKRAWDSLKSPKFSAAKRDESVGKKLAGVLQNGAMAVGLDRGKEEKVRKEE